MRISDWSSDVCSSDLRELVAFPIERHTPDIFDRLVLEIGKPAIEFESVKPLSDRARGERADRNRGAGIGVTETRRDERHSRHGSRNHSKPTLTHQTCPSTGEIVDQALIVGQDLARPGEELLDLRREPGEALASRHKRYTEILLKFATRRPTGRLGDTAGIGGAGEITPFG